ncbi:MAG TPA: hypothetical protein VF128_09055 [Gemmatimonadaceae bacterium]
MMRNKGWALVLAAAVFSAACTDATSPTRALTGDVSANVSTQQTNTFPTGLDWGEVRVCKTIAADDPAQTFNYTYTVTPVIPSGAPETPVNFSIDALPGQTVCNDIYDSGPITGSQYDQVVIVENAAPANWTLSNIDVVRYIALAYSSPQGFFDSEDEATSTATVYVNSDEGRIVTFTNDYSAPTPSGCTYTKGWYRNNGSSTVISVDGRTVADAQAIFAATPGKPGSVTFGGDATLLNLYQQFLAALNNLGGDANAHNGPQAVDDAIDAVDLGTSDGPGLAITTTLTQTEMSGYIATLSQFNEGLLTGWPHCAD